FCSAGFVVHPLRLGVAPLVQVRGKQPAETLEDVDRSDIPLLRERSFSRPFDALFQRRADHAFPPACRAGRPIRI
ncbi:MAG: hypothetical protein ACREQ5_32380, partial [Candidatus Dormibacteria bacterium]